MAICACDSDGIASGMLASSKNPSDFRMRILSPRSLILVVAQHAAPFRGSSFRPAVLYLLACASEFRKRLSLVIPINPEIPEKSHRAPTTPPLRLVWLPVPSAN